MKIKIDGYTNSKQLMRLGKIHFDIAEHYGQVNKHVTLILQVAKYKASTIEFDVSVCDPQML
jgi:hypothetical protein